MTDVDAASIDRLPSFAATVVLAAAQGVLVPTDVIEQAVLAACREAS